MATYNKNTESWCSSCSKPKEKKNFIVSLNPDHANFLPFCRTCINAKLKKYKEATGSDGAALYCLCAELGYPVIKEYYDIAMKMFVEKPSSTTNSNIFTMYHNTLRDMGFIVQGLWQSDMELSDFIQMDKIEDDKPIDYDELNRLWGKFEPDDYILLEEFFKMYTEDIPEMDTPMELRYRDLCKAELRKRKADEGGDKAEIKEAENSIKSNLNMLKLDNFSNNKQSDIEKHIERKAWMIENNKPCECEDLEKYKDFSNFGIKWDEIMRCVQNLICGTRDYPDVPKGEE